ncbi:MAG: hypothetical protein KJP03_04750 [Gammaproteobacteria bacterium]|nr:hypothetical protein [Gammaproteobacteria bacterium]
MSDISQREEQQHWLVRPSSIRLMWWVFACVLALTVLAQVVIKVKGYFGADGWLGFGAVFGFVSCVAMVFVAKALGVFLKREDTYYDDREAEAAADD